MKDILDRIDEGIRRLDDIEESFGMQYESIVKDILQDTRFKIEELQDELQGYKDKYD